MIGGVLNQRVKEARGDSRPSFMFIGPSKAGSSWFFEILREHPQVFIPANKATFFFSDNYAKGMVWYESFFSGGAHQRVVGEICHDYLASPEALRRIWEYRPDMRVICCLRNPYARALSSWRFFGRNGMDEPTLAAQAQRNSSVFEHGYYATQLAVLNSFFPKTQILTFFFEDLSNQPESVVRRLYEFVGVDSTFLPPSLHRRVNVNAKPRSRQAARLMQLIHQQSWKRSHHLSNFIGQVKRIRLLRRFVRTALYKQPMSTTDWREHLNEFPEHIISRYEMEISELERTLGKDLAAWHAPLGNYVDHSRQQPSNFKQAGPANQPRAANASTSHHVIDGGKSRAELTAAAEPCEARPGKI